MRRVSSGFGCAARVAVLFVLLAALVIDDRGRAVTAIDAGSITPVQTSIASGATAVLANLTMTNGRSSGYITAGRCSTLQAGPQPSSTGNFDANQTVANLAVVPVDTDGRFCILNQSRVELLADVQGYL